MHELRCPSCGKVFTVDESGYAAIVKQVRDREFQGEVREREERLCRERDSAVEIARLEQRREAEAERERLSAEIAALKERLGAERERAADAVRTAEAAKDLEIAALSSRLEGFESGKRLELAALESRSREALAGRERQLQEERSRAQLREREHELELEALRREMGERLRFKDEEIERYKDFKARLSTKMVGESLERHCESAFNALRPVAFRGAYFEKDNDARTGSKGDYIYRESDSDGVEFISIMFEMKNESDTTATRHRNEDFLRELDKDRREKGCEYAVLVSMLEPESELYAQGIVDMSHRYERMYVVRPQFFIPIISILRNAALGSLGYRRELERLRGENVDVTHFEEALGEFKGKFAKNYELARRKFDTAIEEIDKTITHLQKVKESLQSSGNNLRLANQKAEELTVKRLTRNSPGMAERFARLRGD
ncbi:MAG: DUF2130 domain-containing protein [Succinivibrionaceae bacterium]|nr:DUF2130 domain-containing protein [Succinivibrionaceae bacterium]